MVAIPKVDQSDGRTIGRLVEKLDNMARVAGLIRDTDRRERASGAESTQPKWLLDLAQKSQPVLKSTISGLLRLPQEAHVTSLTRREDLEISIKGQRLYLYLQDLMTGEQTEEQDGVKRLLGNPLEEAQS